MIGDTVKFIDKSDPYYWYLSDAKLKITREYYGWCQVVGEGWDILCRNKQIRRRKCVK